MHARNIEAAKIIFAKDCLCAFDLRYQTHNPDAGKKLNREVLTNAAIPHSSPQQAQTVNRSLSSRVSVSQKIRANSNAARLVSQTQRVHQKITGGRTAHAQALHFAMRLSKHRRAIKKIGKQVSAENKLLMHNMTIADARV